MIRRIVHFWILLPTLSSLMACGGWSSVTVRGSEGHSQHEDAVVQQAMVNPDFLNLMEESLANYGEIDQSDANTIWAVAHSQKFAHQKSNLLGKWAKSRGALPQILTPSIRHELETNVWLQKAASMPDFLRSLLKFFVDDSYILSEIHKQITSMVDKILQRDTKLHTKVDYRFDHFLTAKPTSATGEIAYSEFNFEEQFIRWFHVYSIDNFWDDEAPLSGDNHALQLLSSLQILSELQYTLGLALPGESKGFGGLTLDINAGPHQQPAPFDLRTDPQAKRYMSGRFKISYKNGDIVDIASDLNETWTAIPSPTTLDEQAKLWMAGAELFKRLRPSHYEQLSSFYDHAICKEAFGLPLSILASMNAMLNGPIIDLEARLIRKFAKVPTNSQSDEMAGILEAARATHAVYLWAQQLQNQDDLYATKSEHGLELTVLKDAFPRLKEVLQFFLQFLIKNYIGPDHIDETANSLNLSELAEVIVVLSKIEQNLIQSKYLKSAVEQLTRHFFVKKINSELSQPKLSKAEVAWVIAVIDTLAEGDNPFMKTKEFAELHSFVQEKMDP